MNDPVVSLLDDPCELAESAAPPDWPALSREAVRQHAPDVSLVVRDGGILRARCSLWWTAAPPLDGHRVGVIGHYGASDDAAAQAVLERACAELARHDRTIALGPMDGNTWRSYRFVTERGTEPPFFLEPTNPPEWPAQWCAADFTPVAHYSSALDPDLGRRDERATRAEARLAAHGVSLRRLDPESFGRELERIYSVAAVAFRQNFLYTPIPEAAFAAQYRQIEQLIVPELVLIAEHEGRAVGFAFTLPDVLERARGEAVRTAIIKTVAILPERRYGGLGTGLVDATRRAAHELGFERAVHALMFDANASRSISGRTGQPMRDYTLFARPLA